MAKRAQERHPQGKAAFLRERGELSKDVLDKTAKHLGYLCFIIPL